MLSASDTPMSRNILTADDFRSINEADLLDHFCHGGPSEFTQRPTRFNVSGIATSLRYAKGVQLVMTTILCDLDADSLRAAFSMSTGDLVS